MAVGEKTARGQGGFGDLTTPSRFSELAQRLAAWLGDGHEENPDFTGVLTQNRPQTRAVAWQLRDFPALASSRTRPRRPARGV